MQGLYKASRDYTTNREDAAGVEVAIRVTIAEMENGSYVLSTQCLRGDRLIGVSFAKKTFGSWWDATGYFDTYASGALAFEETIVAFVGS